VLFGTDWPVFPMPRAIAEWRELALKPAVLEALLGGNAGRLLTRATSSASAGG
jgi:predicted TIM-barrel fold metal-dependent hydrolase